MEIKFTFARETKKFNVFKMDNEATEFFPKSIYLSKEETDNCKKVTLTIKAEE